MKGLKEKLIGIKKYIYWQQNRRKALLMHAMGRTIGAGRRKVSWSVKLR